MNRLLTICAVFLLLASARTVSQTFPADDLKNNVLPVACLACLASEDPQFIARERCAMPADRVTGKGQEWPPVKEPKRERGMNDMKDR